MCKICDRAKRIAQMRSIDGQEDWSIIQDHQYEHTGRLAEAEAIGQSIIEYGKGKDRWGCLHGHSEGSLLDGGAKVNDIMIKAKQMGQDFVAITDHGNLYSAVRAHQSARDVGIKHIVGTEFYVTPWGLKAHEKDFAKGERAYFHLVALAMNNTGYHNLAKLSSIGYRDGYYRQPRIDRETLEAHSEGLIVTTSCVGGSIPSSIYKGDMYKAQEELEWYMKVFGDRFYIELQNHGIEVEDASFYGLRELNAQYGIKEIVTPDSHYLNIEDKIPHDALLCVGTGQKVDQEIRTFQFSGSGYHYMAEEEIHKLFPSDKQAIYETGRLADRIDDKVINLGQVKLPEFQVEESVEEFDAWVKEGGYNRWLKQ